MGLDALLKYSLHNNIILSSHNHKFSSLFSMGIGSSLCCPITREQLRLIEPFEFSQFVEKKVDCNADYLLVSSSGKVAYPVNDGVPYLAVEHAIGVQLPRSPIADSHHEEIRRESMIYDHIAKKNKNRLATTIRTVFGEDFEKAVRAGNVPDTFPKPEKIWIDAVGCPDTQLEAYRFLSPLRNKTFLQVGGSGSHAVKALLAGASAGALLSPSIEEIRLGRSVAEEFGVSDRFLGILGIAELMPLKNGSIDRIYGGGCLHHTDISKSLAEVGRVLESTARASFVDPVNNPIYRAWEKFTGRIRFLEDEESTHDHPIDRPTLEIITNNIFSNTKFYLSGSLTRYGIVLCMRLFGLRLSVSSTACLFRIERRLLLLLGLKKFFGTIAIMLSH